MKGKISVIIPIYNVSNYLDRCVSSVCNQTYTNLQIILVNDGSTDNSGELCDSYAKKDKRIQVIHKPNGGLVSARKAGLQVAIGEYVAYVDGDDWIEPDMYEHMINEMANDLVDMVEIDAFMDMGKEFILMKNGISYGTYNISEIIPIMLSDDFFNICSLKSYVWSKLFKRKLLEKVQYQVDDSIRFGEDVAVTYPYILQCHKISLINYVGYHYEQRQGSMVHTTDLRELERNGALIRGLWSCFSENEDIDILKKQLNQYAKLLFLLRNISYFDRYEEEKVLTPYGGVDTNESVLVYGAGRVGQGVYHYLSSIKTMTVLCWVDREYKKYQQMGFDVLAPEKVFNEEYKNKKIIIAVNDQRAIQGIYNWLVENGADAKNIIWMTDKFIRSDFLKELLNDKSISH